MKSIQVMGPGCAKCDEAERLVKETVAEQGIEATIEKVDDFKKMAVLGVFSTPAIAIDGVVKVVGRVPKKDELLSWLT